MFPSQLIISVTRPSLVTELLVASFLDSLSLSLCVPPSPPAHMYALFFALPQSCCLPQKLTAPGDLLSSLHRHMSSHQNIPRAPVNLGPQILSISLKGGLLLKWRRGCGCTLLPGMICAMRLRRHRTRLRFGRPDRSRAATCAFIPPQINNFQALHDAQVVPNLSCAVKHPQPSSLMASLIRSS